MRNINVFKKLSNPSLRIEEKEYIKKQTINRLGTIQEKKFIKLKKLINQEAKNNNNN